METKTSSEILFMEPGSSNPSVCGICWQQYSKNVHTPITLRCGHTFCKKCLIILGRGRSSIHCATCRAKIFANTKRLTKNFQMLELLNKFGLLREDLVEETNEPDNQENPAHQEHDFIRMEMIQRIGDVFEVVNRENAPANPLIPVEIQIEPIANPLEEQNPAPTENPEGGEQNMEGGVHNEIPQVHQPLAEEHHPAAEDQQAPNDEPQNQLPLIEPPNPQVMAEIEELCANAREMLEPILGAFEELREIAQNFQGDVRSFRNLVHGVLTSLMEIVYHPVMREVTELYRRQRAQRNPNQEVRRRVAAMDGVGIGAVHVPVADPDLLDELRMQEILMEQFANRRNEGHANNDAAQNQDVPAAIIRAQENEGEFLAIIRALMQVEGRAGDVAREVAMGMEGDSENEDDDDSMITALEIGFPRREMHVEMMNMVDGLVDDDEMEVELHDLHDDNSDETGDENPNP